MTPSRPLCFPPRPLTGKAFTRLSSWARRFFKDGQVQLRSLYLLDATSLAAPADTQFFCSNVSGSLTVTMNMHALPPGKYAVVLADAAGAPFAGQIGLVLSTPPQRPPPGSWQASPSAREASTATTASGTGPTPASWSRRTSATQLACMVQLRGCPLPACARRFPLLARTWKSSLRSRRRSATPLLDAFPYSLQDGDRTWKIEAIRIDASLRQPDLAVSYDSTGVSDPAAVHTEASAVLSALLKAQPGLRANFHGLWAFAIKDGKPSPIIELPMNQIP